MCGIFGFNFSDKKLAYSMGKLLHHRGPDDKKIWEDKEITLGYTRLSIIDLKTGNQPILNEDNSIVLFFNGEIYNFKEIKKNLEKKGHKFNTNTDSEVIVHSYEEYGKECLKYFNGMFAFVIYDITKKELFIARDRLGVKPLYYYFKDSTFLFASEIKAILEHTEINRKLNYSSINNYFTFRYCPGKETAFEDIYKLLPGHYLIYKNYKIEIKKYWDLNFTEGNKSFDFYSNKFFELFEQSVKYRMISDVPIGALLSGGIDSSSIVAMMSKNSEEEIKTFTIGFDEGFKNEFKDAKLVSEKFNTNHSEYMIDPTYVKYLPKVIWHLDEPLADPTAIPNYVLSEKASKKVKVLINGDGADELFGGYEQYKLMKIWEVYHNSPESIRKIIAFPLRVLPPEPFIMKVNEFLKGKTYPESYVSLISVFGKKEKEIFYANEFKDKLKGIDTINAVKGYFDTPKQFVNKMLYTDIKTYLPDNMLMKYDKITMAKSIEGRVPFCDYKLAEFSSNLPTKYKLNFLTDKYLLRKSMTGILPKKILKKKKQRFLVPTDNWLKRDFGDLVERVFDEKKGLLLDFFDKSFIKKLSSSENLFSNKILRLNNLTSLYYSRQIWTITNFLIWHDIFIENNSKYLKKGIL